MKRNNLTALLLAILVAISSTGFAYAENQEHPPETLQASTYSNDSTTVGTLTVSGGEQGVDFEYTTSSTGNSIKILTSKEMTISGSTQDDRIVINAGVNANITISNLRIEQTGIMYTPIEVKSGASLDLTLEGENYIAGSFFGAIFVPAGAELTIDGTGSLEAHSCTGSTVGQAAAIGGSAQGNKNAGSIRILGGTVTAVAGSKSGSAGIGGAGGSNPGKGDGGTIYIGGDAVVYAEGASGAAGIGGAYNGATGTESEGFAAEITITDNAVVEAVGGSGAAAVGGSKNSGAGTIEIGGEAQLTVQAGAGASDIGTGSGSYSHTTDKVVISGGTILSASDDPVVIGVGEGENAGTIQIGENATFPDGNNTSVEPGPIITPPEPEEEDTPVRETGDYFGNEKWDEVKKEIAKLIEDAEPGETIEMSATGLPWFPSSVARALKGYDITLEVRKNGVTYSVNGLRIGAIDKIWYEFDELEEELLTAEPAEAE